MRGASSRRRRASILALVALGVIVGCGQGGGPASALELKTPDTATTTRYDFESRGADGWKVVDGEWTVEEMAYRRASPGRDARFKAGRVGLWTKADSVTAFDDLVISGVPSGGGG